MLQMNRMKSIMFMTFINSKLSKIVSTTFTEHYIAYELGVIDGGGC